MLNKEIKVILDPKVTERWQQRVYNVVDDAHAEESLKLFKDIYPQLILKPITDVVTEGEDVEEQIRELFGAFGDFYEVYQDGEYLCIDIEDGDWKHAHAHCDYVMETAFGLICKKEEVWEESEDDSYSATHFYITKEERK